MGKHHNHQDLRFKLNEQRKLRKKLKSVVFVVHLPSNSHEQDMLNYKYRIPKSSNQKHQVSGQTQSPRPHEIQKKSHVSKKKTLKMDARPRHLARRQSSNNHRIILPPPEENAFIRESDDSWSIFVEEEGVLSLKDLCVIAVQKNFRQLHIPLRELPFHLQWDVHRNF